MATVWELVTEASSLPDDGVNTFWDHLSNLDGSGPGGSLVLLDGLSLVTEMDEYDLEIDLDYVLTLDTPEFTLEIEPTEYYLEVDDE